MPHQAAWVQFLCVSSDSTFLRITDPQRQQVMGEVLKSPWGRRGREET